MVTTMQLLIPLLAASVGVFFASALIHMVFKWHNADYLKLPNEDEVAAALRRASPPPGQYTLPHCADMKQMQTPEMQQKLKDGPNGFVILRANGLPNMGKHLGQWFVLTLIVAGIVACICSVAFGAGAEHRRVFHVAALLTFAAYGVGPVVDGIWMGHPWRVVWKNVFDAAIYAGITGTAFALLWPN